MNERERLVELLNRAPIGYETLGERLYKSAIITLADDLLANGVIVPPVKVGQNVYYIFEGFIEPCTVDVIFLSDYVDREGNSSYIAEIHFDREDCPYRVDEVYFTDIGKTVFLTQKQAEKALKGGAANE